MSFLHGVWAFDNNFKSKRFLFKWATIKKISIIYNFKN